MSESITRLLKALMHVQTDSYGEGTQKLEGFTLNATSGMLISYLSELKDATKDKEEYAFIEGLIKDLAGLTIQPTAEELINSLLKDGHVLMAGGWAAATVGHAMLYEFFYDEKTQEISFLVHNSGAGLEYHDTIIDESTGKKKYCTVRKFTFPFNKDTPDQVEAFTVFLTLLRDLTLKVKEHNNASHLYTQLLPKIAYLGGKAVKLKDEEMIFTSAQSSGTCAQKSLNMYLKKKFLDEHGENGAKEYKRFIYRYKKFILQQHIDNLSERLENLSDSAHDDKESKESYELKSIADAEYRNLETEFFHLFKSIENLSRIAATKIPMTEEEKEEELSYLTEENKWLKNTLQALKTTKSNDEKPADKYIDSYAEIPLDHVLYISETISLNRMASLENISSKYVDFELSVDENGIPTNLLKSIKNFNQLLSDKSVTLVSSIQSIEKMFKQLSLDLNFYSSLSSLEDITTFKALLNNIFDIYCSNTKKLISPKDNRIYPPENMVYFYHLFMSLCYTIPYLKSMELYGDKDYMESLSENSGKEKFESFITLHEAMIKQVNDLNSYYLNIFLKKHPFLDQVYLQKEIADLELLNSKMPKIDEKSNEILYYTKELVKLLPYEIEEVLKKFESDNKAKELFESFEGADKQGLSEEQLKFFSLLLSDFKSFYAFKNSEKYKTATEAEKFFYYLLQQINDFYSISCRIKKLSILEHSFSFTEKTLPWNDDHEDIHADYFRNRHSGLKQGRPDTTTKDLEIKDVQEKVDIENVIKSKNTRSSRKIKSLFSGASNREPFELHEFDCLISRDVSKKIPEPLFFTSLDALNRDDFGDIEHAYWNSSYHTLRTLLLDKDHMDGVNHLQKYLSALTTSSDKVFENIELMINTYGKTTNTLDTKAIFLFSLESSCLTYAINSKRDNFSENIKRLNVINGYIKKILSKKKNFLFKSNVLLEHQFIQNTNIILKHHDDCHDAIIEYINFTLKSMRKKKSTIEENSHEVMESYKNTFEINEKIKEKIHQNPDLLMEIKEIISKETGFSLEKLSGDYPILTCNADSDSAIQINFDDRKITAGEKDIYEKIPDDFMSEQEKFYLKSAIGDVNIEYGMSHYPEPGWCTAFSFAIDDVKYKLFSDPFRVFREFTIDGETAFYEWKFGETENLWNIFYPPIRGLTFKPFLDNSNHAFWVKCNSRNPWDNTEYDKKPDKNKTQEFILAKRETNEILFYGVEKEKTIRDDDGDYSADFAICSVENGIKQTDKRLANPNDDMIKKEPFLSINKFENLNYAETIISNKSSDPIKVNLFRYNIQLEINHPSKPDEPFETRVSGTDWQVLRSDHPTVENIKNQMNGLDSFLVLENKKGEKKLLLPRQKFVPIKSSDKEPWGEGYIPLELDTENLVNNQKTKKEIAHDKSDMRQRNEIALRKKLLDYNNSEKYYEYDLNEKDTITVKSPINALYLTHIYMGKYKPETALMHLNAISKLGSLQYNTETLSLLSWIATKESPEPLFAPGRKSEKSIHVNNPEYTGLRYKTLYLFVELISRDSDWKLIPEDQLLKMQENLKKLSAEEQSTNENKSLKAFIENQTLSRKLLSEFVSLRKHYHKLNLNIPKEFLLNDEEESLLFKTYRKWFPGSDIGELQIKESELKLTEKLKRSLIEKEENLKIGKEKEYSATALNSKTIFSDSVDNKWLLLKTTYENKEKLEKFSFFNIDIDDKTLSDEYEARKLDIKSLCEDGTLLFSLEFGNDEEFFRTIESLIYLSVNMQNNTKDKESIALRDKALKLIDKIFSGNYAVINKKPETQYEIKIRFRLDLLALSRQALTSHDKDKPTDILTALKEKQLFSKEDRTANFESFENRFKDCIAISHQKCELKQIKKTYDLRNIKASADKITYYEALTKSDTNQSLTDKKQDSTPEYVISNKIIDKTEEDIVSEWIKKQKKYESTHERILAELADLYKNKAFDYRKYLSKIGELDLKAAKSAYDIKTEKLKLANDSIEKINIEKMLSDLSTDFVRHNHRSASNLTAALALANKISDPLGLTNKRLRKLARLHTNLNEQDLLRLFLHADILEYREKTQLSDEDIKQLHLLIGQHINEEFKKSHVNKCKKLLNEFTQDKSAENLADLLDALTQKNYVSIDNPEQMIFQYEQGFFLKEKQVEYLKRFMEKEKTENGDSIYRQEILQLIMGGGKSTVLLPILALKKANGTNLSIIEVSKALLETNFQDLNFISKKLFNQSAYLLKFDRKIIREENSSHALENLYKELNSVITSKGYVVTTKESLKSIQLSYFDLLNTASKYGKADKNIDNNIILIRKILDIFKYQGDTLIDEVDSSLDIKNKLVYQLGENEPLPAHHINTCLELHRFLHKNNITVTDDIEQWKHQVFEKFYAQEGSSLSKISKKLLEVSDEKTIKETLSNFLFSNGQIPADWIPYLGENGIGVLNILKTEITDLIPFSFEKVLFENFGPADPSLNSTNYKDYLMIPYSGNNTPKLNSKFSDHLTVMNYSIKFFNENGIPEKLFFKLLSESIREIRQQTDLDEIKEATDRFLLNFNVPFNTLDLENDEQLEQFYLDSRFSPTLIYNLILTKVFAEIKSEGETIQSTTQNYVDMLHSVQGTSGTAANTDAMPMSLHFDPAVSLGTDSSTEVLLREKGTPIVSYTGTNGSFSDIMEQLSPGGNYRTLIDVGSYFVGINNKAVASQISLYLSQNTAYAEKIKYVLFFDDNVLKAMTVGDPSQITDLGTSNQDIINEKLKCGPESCFTYYDQVHTRGTNIKQIRNAEAIVMSRETDDRSDFFQAIRRMRDLDNTHIATVVLFKDKILSKTKETEEELKIKDSEEKEISAYINKISENQTNKQLDLNLSAAIEQMNGALESISYDILLECPPENVESQIETFTTLRNIFVHSAESYIDNNFIGNKIEQKTITILLSIKERLLQKARPCLDEKYLQLLTQKIEQIIANYTGKCKEIYAYSEGSIDKDREYIQEELQEQIKEQVKEELREEEREEMQEYSIDDSFFNQFEAYQSEQSINEFDTLSKLLDSNYFLLGEKTTQLGKIHVKLKNTDSDKKTFSINSIENIFTEDTIRFSDQFVNVYNLDKTKKDLPNYFYNNALKIVYPIIFKKTEKGLKCYVVTHQEMQTILDNKQLNTGLENGAWAEHASGDILGKRSEKPSLTADESLQYLHIKEQLQFFNGDFDKLLKQEDFHWIKYHFKYKMEFFEKLLAPSRRIHQIKPLKGHLLDEQFKKFKKLVNDHIVADNLIDSALEKNPNDLIEYIQKSDINKKLKNQWNHDLMELFNKAYQGKNEQQAIIDLVTKLFSDRNYSQDRINRLVNCYLFNERYHHRMDDAAYTALRIKTMLNEPIDAEFDEKAALDLVETKEKPQSKPLPAKLTKKPMQTEKEKVPDTPPSPIAKAASSSEEKIEKSKKAYASRFEAIFDKLYQDHTKIREAIEALQRAQIAFKDAVGDADLGPIQQAVQAAQQHVEAMLTELAALSIEPKPKKRGILNILSCLNDIFTLTGDTSLILLVSKLKIEAKLSNPDTRSIKKLVFLCLQAVLSVAKFITDLAVSIKAFAHNTAEYRDQQLAALSAKFQRLINRPPRPSG